MDKFDNTQEQMANVSRQIEILKRAPKINTKDQMSHRHRQGLVMGSLVEWIQGDREMFTSKM